MSATPQGLPSPFGHARSSPRAQPAVIRLYIRHRVRDYAKWRRHYDAFDAERRAMGVIAAGVSRRVGDPNDVTVWHDFADLATGKAFYRSDRLRDVMANAGVAHAPEFWFAEID